MPVDGDAVAGVGAAVLVATSCDVGWPLEAPDGGRPLPITPPDCDCGVYTPERGAFDDTFAGVYSVELLSTTDD